MRLLAFAFALCGMVLTAAVMMGAPALNPSLRVAGPSGDWRVADGAALHDRPEYLSRVAGQFQDADRRSAASDLSDDPERLADLVRADGERSEALLLESLSLAPADAGTWAALAWSRLMQGNAPAAHEALVRSWALAPHDVPSATSRLAAADLIATAYPAAGLEADLLAGVTGDLRTLARHRRATLRAYLAGSDYLAGIARDAGIAP